MRLRHPRAASRAAPSLPALVRVALAAVVVVAGVLLAGCSALGGEESGTAAEGTGQEPPSFTDKAEMAAWVAGATPELSSLGTSVAGLATAAQGGDLAQVEVQLDTIEADVDALREDPAPDPRIDDPLQELLTTVSDGSTTVREGIEQQDLGTVQEGAQAFADAQGDVEALLQAAQEYATA